MSPVDGSGPSMDADEFREALAKTVYAAVHEGVEVRGGWDISNEDEHNVPSFTIEIYATKR